MENWNLSEYNLRNERMEENTDICWWKRRKKERKQVIKFESKDNKYERKRKFKWEKT